MSSQEQNYEKADRTRDKFLCAVAGTILVGAAVANYGEDALERLGIESSRQVDADVLIDTPRTYVGEDVKTSGWLTVISHDVKKEEIESIRTRTRYTVKDVYEARLTGSGTESIKVEITTREGGLGGAEFGTFAGPVTVEGVLKQNDSEPTNDPYADPTYTLEVDEVDVLN